MNKYRHMTYEYLSTYKTVMAIVFYEIVAIVLHEQFKTDIRIPCIWKSLFGFKCLGCGLATAFGCLLQFRFSEAYAVNALIYPVITISGLFFTKHFKQFINQHQTK